MVPKIIVSMTLLTLLLSTNLLVMVMGIFTGSSKSWEDCGRLKNYRMAEVVKPLRYTIDLTLKQYTTFTGESDVNIRLLQPTRNLSLHAKDLDVKEAILISNNLEDDIIYHPRDMSYCPDQNILIIQFDTDLNPGFFILRTNFVGKIFSMIPKVPILGFYKLYSGDLGFYSETTYISALKMTGARKVFPCWDKPEFKSFFKIKIWHNTSYTALSNMPVKSRLVDDFDNNIARTIFKSLPRTSTYSLAIVLTKHPNIIKNNVTSIWANPILLGHIQFAHNVSNVLVTYLSKLYSEKPRKLDRVLCTNHLYVNGGSLGLIVERASDLIYVKGVSDIIYERSVVLDTALPITRQWFLNLIGPSKWSDLWIFEGLSKLFQYLSVQANFYPNIMNNFVILHTQMFLHNELVYNFKPLIDEKNAEDCTNTDLISYEVQFTKASIIMRMLRQSVGESVFDASVKKLINLMKFSSITEDNFYEIIEKTWNESDFNTNYNIKEIMYGWTTQNQYPLVIAQRSKNLSEIIITQTPFFNNSTLNKWWIPLTYTTKSNSNFSQTMPSHWLRPEDHNIQIAYIHPDDWFIVNLQQVGYYRVNYDIDNWQKIVKHLNSENFHTIHVLNRAQILNDAYHLVMSDRLEKEIFYDILNYLHLETEFEPLYTLKQILEFMSPYFNFPESAYMKECVKNIFGHHIRRLGYTENPDKEDINDIDIRRLALEMACKFGDYECKQQSTIMLSKYLNTEEQKLQPWWKDWLFCFGLMRADSHLWNEVYLKLFNEFSINQDGTNFEYLTCVEDVSIILQFLMALIKNDDLIYIVIRDEIFADIMTQHIMKEGMLDGILNIINSVLYKKTPFRYSKYPISLPRFEDIIDNLYDIEMIYKVELYVKFNFHMHPEEEVFFDQRIFNQIEKMKIMINKYVMRLTL